MEVVDHQRQVRGQRLAGSACRCPHLGDREHLEVLLDAVGDLVEDRGALGTGAVLPQRALAHCAASSARSMSSAVDRRISQNAQPVTGVMFWVLALHLGAHHSPPMKLA